MPQYPHRPIVQAVDRLTAQMKRIADQLEERPIDEDAVAELAELRRALDPDDETYINETVDEQQRLNAKIREQQAALTRVRAVRNQWALNTLEPGQVRRLLDDLTHALADPTPEG